MEYQKLNTFLSILENYRNNNKISYYKLALITGIKQEQIKKILTKKTTNPSFIYLSKIAEALNHNIILCK